MESITVTLSSIIYVDMFFLWGIGRTLCEQTRSWGYCIKGGGDLFVFYHIGCHILTLKCQDAWEVKKDARLKAQTGCST